MKRALATGLLAMAIAAPAGASNTGSYGLVETVYGTRNGAVLFSVSGATVARSSDIPACAASNPKRWAIDASTIAGQASMHVLLAAYAQHKPVYVTGTGNCSIWGDTETVDFFNIQDQ